jgi:hypothetical protein
MSAINLKVVHDLGGETCLNCFSYKPSLFFNALGFTHLDAVWQGASRASFCGKGDTFIGSFGGNGGTGTSQRAIWAEIGRGVAMSSSKCAEQTVWQSESSLRMLGESREKLRLQLHKYVREKFKYKIINEESKKCSEGNALGNGLVRKI